MSEQYATYQVPIWQAGWALSTLNSAGIPILNTARQGDMIVIIIPAQYAEFNHRAASAHKRRRWLRLPSGRVMFWLILAIVGAVGLWVFLSGGVNLQGATLPSVPSVAPTVPDVTGLQGAMDGAINAAKTLTVAVVTAAGLFVAFKFRGTLGAMAGAVGNLVKGFRNVR